MVSCTATVQRDETKASFATHIYSLKKVKWKKRKKNKSTCHLNNFNLVIFYCCHFFCHVIVVYQYFFPRWRQTSTEQKGSLSKVPSEFVLSRIVLEQQPGIKKSFWGWFKPIYKDIRQFSPNQFRLFGILHPKLNMSKTKTMFVIFIPLRKCPWKWHDLGAYLTSKALSLSPSKPSWALLRQGVVVGILLWSVKQHLSVGDTENRASWRHTYVGSGCF